MNAKGPRPNAYAPPAYDRDPLTPHNKDDAYIPIYNAGPLLSWYFYEMTTGFVTLSCRFTFFLHPHQPIFMQVINHWITLFFVCRYLFYHLLLFNFHLYSSTCIPSYTLRHFSYICRNKWNHVFLFYSCMEQALRLPKRSRLLFHRESDCDPILVQARCPVDNNRWYPCLVRGSTSSNHNNYLFIPGPRYKSNSQARFSCWM